MALTLQQRADIRLYLGWPARFRQTDSELDQAMNAMDTDAESSAQITNPIDGNPPGIIAQLRQIDAELVTARKRYKADKVGSIELNRSEPSRIRSDGRALVTRLSALLTVAPRRDVFASSTGDNWIGK